MKPTMKISESGLNKLIEYEGIRLMPYLDTGKKLTIGVGHLITKSERMSGKIKIGGTYVKYSLGLKQKQCLDLLDQDCNISEDAVNLLVKRTITQDQFDSLVSFVFNIGVEAFMGSTLLKILNKGATNEEIIRQLARWVYDDGKIINGLVIRRIKESEAFK